MTPTLSGYIHKAVCDGNHLLASQLRAIGEHCAELHLPEVVAELRAELKRTAGYDNARANVRFWEKSATLYRLCAERVAAVHNHAVADAACLMRQWPDGNHNYDVVDVIVQIANVMAEIEAEPSFSWENQGIDWDSACHHIATECGETGQVPSEDVIRQHFAGTRVPALRT